MGWLQKQSFTKTVTDPEAEGLASPTKKTSGNVFTDFKNRVKTSIISPYQRRWFVLSTEKKCLIYYKDDSAVLIESGSIEMSQIIDVQKSAFTDAPPFTLFLKSEKIFPEVFFVGLARPSASGSVTVFVKLCLCNQPMGW